MQRVARFEKVSFDRFIADFKDTFPEFSDSQIKEIYEEIKLPKRATAKSAGYDIYMPIDIKLEPGKTVKIPTGTPARYLYMISRCRFSAGT